MDIIEKALSINEDRRMLKEELELIWARIEELYKGGNTLEIGAYKGMTSYLFVNMLDKHNSDSKHFIVDVFDSKATGDTSWNYEKHTAKMLLDNLGKYKKYVRILKGESSNSKIVKVIKKNKFDYAFIDGDHRYPEVLNELILCDKVTDNILGHDYGHTGVTQSVDEFCKLKGYKVNQWQEKFGLFEIIK